MMDQIYQNNCGPSYIYEQNFSNNNFSEPEFININNFYQKKEGEKK